VEIWERRKREGNHSLTKNKVVQDLEQNEENGYPDTDSNKTKQGTQKSPQEHTERRNPTSNQREFHRDITRHG
jgi:hypothetical protein